MLLFELNTRTRSDDLQRRGRRFFHYKEKEFNETAKQAMIDEATVEILARDKDADGTMAKAKKLETEAKEHRTQQEESEAAWDAACEEQEAIIADAAAGNYEGAAQRMEACMNEISQYSEAAAEKERLATEKETEAGELRKTKMNEARRLAVMEVANETEKARAEMMGQEQETTEGKGHLQREVDKASSSTADGQADSLNEIRTEYKSSLESENNTYDIVDGLNESVEKAENINYNRGGINGAYNDKNDPDEKGRNAHADRYYTSLRNAKKIYVVDAIAKNTGIDSVLVSNMYDHLLVNEYELEGGVKRFDTDYDIAQSLQRLRDGKNIQEHDLILIRHEALEYELMNSYGMKYDEAHEKANESYNYAKALRSFIREKESE